MINDLIDLNSNAIDNIVAKTKGLGKNWTTGILKPCENVILEPSPSATYYLDEATHYKAKYGNDKDTWGEEAGITKIKEQSEFNKVACITDMVKFIVQETKQVYLNTNH